MRFTLGIFCVFIAGVCLGLALPHPPTTTTGSPMSAQYYAGKFDDIDLDEVLSNERLLKNYIKCLENMGPCTPDAKMLKEILPDAVSTDCTKCTEKQKTGANKVTQFLIDNRPEDWQRLEKIYDPAGTYRLNYLADKRERSDAQAAPQDTADNC